MRLVTLVAFLPAVLAYPPSFLKAGPSDLRERDLFDFERHRIDVTGEHAYQPPDFEADDQRGPCPGMCKLFPDGPSPNRTHGQPLVNLGMNALANHNFIPHNGIVSVTQAITASREGS